MTVTSEIDNSLLLQQSVEHGIEYQRQGETIIAWCETATSLDLALSFQDISRCSEVWEEIDNAAQRIGQKLVHHISDDGNELERDDTRCIDYSTDDSDIQLPSVSEDTLHDIIDKLTEKLYAKNIFVKEISKDKYMYIKSIYKLFDEFESTQQYDKCHLISIIMRQIILLNEVSILDFLTKKIRIYHTYSTLEYTHSYDTYQDTYRRFLEQSYIKILIRFDDKIIQYKIQQNFYLNYLKEKILYFELDENTSTSIASMIYVNNINIITRITDDHLFLQHLFQLFHSNTLPHPNTTKPSDTQNELNDQHTDTSDNELHNDSTSTHTNVSNKCSTIEHVGSEKLITSTSTNKIELYSFIVELITLSKNIQIEIKNSFFYLLLSEKYGLLNNIASSINNPITHNNHKLLSILIDIINNIIQFDLKIIQQYITDSNSNHQFMTNLFLCLTNQKLRSNTIYGIINMLHQLLDNDNTNNPTNATDISSNTNNQLFTNQFYDLFVKSYITNVVHYVQSVNVATITKIQYTMCISNIEFIIWLINNQQNDNYMNDMVHIIDTTNVIVHINRLMYSRKHELICLCIRFIRLIVRYNNLILNNILIKKYVLHHILDIYITNNKRYNLLNSVILELLNYIKYENIKPLVSNLVEYNQFDSKLKHIDYVSVFEQLYIRYEQNMEANSITDHTNDTNTESSTSILNNDKSNDDDYLDDTNTDEHEHTDNHSISDHELREFELGLAKVMHTAESKSTPTDDDKLVFGKRLHDTTNTTKSPSTPLNIQPIKRISLDNKQKSPSSPHTNITISSINNKNNNLPSHDTVSPNKSQTLSPPLKSINSTPYRSSPALSPPQLSLSNTNNTLSPIPLDPDSTDVLVNRKRASPNVSLGDMDQKKQKIIEHAIEESHKSPHHNNNHIHNDTQ